jgi:hypothetical protein
LPTLSKIIAQEAEQLGDQKALLIQLLGNFVTVLRRQQKKQCVSLRNSKVKAEAIRKG